MMDPSLNELLQRAQLLISGTKTVTNPQPLDHTLGQILKEANEMHARLSKPTNQINQKDSKEGAQHLLAPYGIDVQKLTAQVEKLDMYETFKPIDLPNTDVEAMIKDEVENTIISVITETNRNIFNLVQRRKKHNTYEEWKNEKLLMLTALDDWEQKENIVAAPCALKAPLMQSQRGKSVALSLSGFELLQAQELIRYNTGEKLDLLRRFTQLAREKLKVGDLPQMWSLLEHMGSKATAPSADDDALRARQVSPQFLKQACMYLEQCFRQQMFDTVNRSCHLIKSSTLQSVYHQVKHYVHLTCQPQSATPDAAKAQEALWPYVYYSLRCGDLPAAIQFFKDAGNIYPDLLQLVQQLQVLDKHHVSDHQLLQETKLKMSLTLQYLNCQQPSNPYKKVVFSILTGYDPQDPHNNIVRTLDDFLWLQLSVHHSATHLNVEYLQSVMRVLYGRKFLADCKATLVYFQLLVLSGHFEVAIEFLARKEETRSHAVHMAIALSELKLLGTSSNRLASLLSGESKDQSAVGRLNLVRLIISYAKEFELTNTLEALHYYYMLRKNKDTDGCNLMTKCIVDLLADNGCQWEMVEYIFGASQSYDSSICCGGIYIQLPDVPCNKHVLAALVACELVKRCDYQPAIRMYIIARDLDKAMALVSSLLAGELHLPEGKSSLRNLLTSLTEEVSVALAGSHKQPQAKTEETYSVLVQLMDFFASYHAGKMHLARGILNDCQLLPNNDLEVNACLQRLKQLGRHVLQVMPNLLLAAMNMTYMEYQQLKRSPLQDHITLQHLQEHAKAMINLAATMPHRIPLETNRRLVRLEIEMHY